MNAIQEWESIEIAKRGDTHLALVHSRTLEEHFMKDGYDVHGVDVTYNDFIVIGPSDDPAWDIEWYDSQEVKLRWIDCVVIDCDKRSCVERQFRDV